MFQKSSVYFSTEESISSAKNHENQEAKNQVEEDDSDQMQDSDVFTLKSEVNDLKEKLKDTQERMMRIAADADNTRKRLEKEKIEGRIYAIADFAKDLLPVIDAFDKAMSSMEDTKMDFESEAGKKVSAIVEGVQLVTKAFQDATKKHGIERLPGKGTPFNPMFHNAIAKISDPTLAQETVIDEFMVGYKIGDRILRTAMVRVGSPD